MDIKSFLLRCRLAGSRVDVFDLLKETGLLSQENVLVERRPLFPTTGHIYSVYADLFGWVIVLHSYPRDTVAEGRVVLSSGLASILSNMVGVDASQPVGIAAMVVWNRGDGSVRELFDRVGEAETLTFDDRYTRTRHHVKNT